MSGVAPPLEGRVRRVPAKITRPSTPAALGRPRLFTRLDRVRRSGGAVWISGQPGAGKTTLVASWVDARRAPAVWLRVDDGDADLATFFHYLALAAQACTRRRIALPALLPEHGDDPEVFARLFFRDFYAALPQGAVVILDDCHTAASESYAAVLHAAVEELPRGIAAALTSRGEPPHRLTRLRAHGTLEVIDGRALELTAAESWALARRRGFSGPRAHLEALRRIVGGWPAGLVLLLERARGYASKTGADATFGYFAGEVLDRADPATRRILLETALLDSPSARLVELVTGDPGAGRVLSSLARRGLFTVRREADPPAYELHALFREFLLARGAEELPPGRAAEVRRAAAASLAAERGACSEAAVMLLADAAAFEEMAALVIREAPSLLLAGRWQTVERWIGLIPPALREQNPWLLHWSGAALVQRDPAEARERLSRALARFEAAGDATGAWLSWAGIVDTILFEWKDLTPLGASLRDQQRLAARFPFPSPEIAARATLAAFTAAMFHQPDHPALPSWSRAVRGLALAAPAPAPVRIAAGAFLLLYEGWLLGEIARGRDVVAAIEPLARDAATPPRSRLHWLACEAPYRFFAGELDACAASAAAAIALAEESGMHLRDYMSRMQETSIAQVRAPQEVDRRLEAMKRVLRTDSPVDVTTMRFHEAIAALHRGHARAAVALGETALEMATAAGYPGAQVFAWFVLSRARARSGDLAGGRRDLRDARDMGERMGSAWIRFIAALIEAEHALDRGSPEAAAGPLSVAFRLAREKGVHPFLVFSRDDVARLCAAALAGGIEADFVQAFIRLEHLRPPESMPAPDRWPWQLQVRVLGAFEVAREGHAVAEAGRQRKPLAVLQALIALGGRAVPEEKLAEALWPEADGDAAHHALETALYRLRRLVGQSAIVQRDRRVSLAPEQCWVDALEVEAHLAAALSVADGGAGRVRGGAATAAARIAALYRGPLLAGEDAPWAALARERLRRKLARWLEVLAAMPADREEAAAVEAQMRAADPELRTRAILRIA